MDKSIGFIGGGRVVRILLEGWAHAGVLHREIAVADPSTAAVDKLRARFGTAVMATDTATAARQDIVVLAAPPPAMAEALAAVRGRLKPDAIVVSLAPKFTLARVAEGLGGFGRVARVIPNAPSVIGAGYNPVAFGVGLEAAARAELRTLLAPLGELPEVAEEKLEAYAVLTAMGPTYFWFQLQALRECAVSFGLSEAEVAPAMKRMVGGAARTLFESGLAPDEVMDLTPSKPLAEMEPHVTELYRTRLPAMLQKIHP